MIRKVSVDMSLNNLVYFSSRNCTLSGGDRRVIIITSPRGKLDGGGCPSPNFLAVRSARLVARESRASQETFPLHTLSTIIVATSTHKSPTLHPF